MKNIHVLPTDKPSRLFQIENDVLRLDHLFSKGRVNKHIYITSDEEIKSNVYALINKVLCKTELLEGKIVSRQLVGGATMDICKSEYLEIILTTDQDLIKDGVQAIDDEFLEWFVKNPSCEEIEFKMNQGRYFDYGGNVHITNAYKIIIPKEEPKQQCKDCNDNLTDCTCIEDTIDMKQETIEYDLLQHIKFCLECKNESQAIRLIEKYGFQKQEESYSEEDMMKAVKFGELYRSEGSKSLFEKKGTTPSEVLNKWFEQIKKK